jgi:membrane-associated protein
VPVVRTFAPVAAGVGKMHPRRYSLYNAIGAFAWGVGVTVVGFLLGNITPVADFVIKYIDVVLLAVVLGTLIPTIIHYLVTRRKARRSNTVETPAETESETVPNLD